MPVSQFELEFKEAKTDDTAFPAVLVAAGNSSRMKGADKQEILLLGIPVLARTLKVFEQSDKISEIVVVTREEKIEWVYSLAKKYGITKLEAVIKGSSCREESVKNGLIFLADKHKKALIHDGARPLVSMSTISMVAEALIKEDCVIPGIKVKDTVKKVNAEGYATETLNRQELISVQTPQGVNIDRFLKAAENNKLDKFTDDASVLESAGVRVKLVEGDQKNIKITTPEDISLAEAYLREDFENEF